MAEVIICHINRGLRGSNELRVALVIIREGCLASQRNDNFLIAGGPLPIWVPLMKVTGPLISSERNI